jgi:hypothetical protein
LPRWRLQQITSSNCKHSDLAPPKVLKYFARPTMAQNTQSTSASRATVPGTANDQPVTPSLFTSPSKRDYIPDAKRVGDGVQAPELEAARAAFMDGDYATARSQARKVVKSKTASAQAKMEAGDLLDRTDIDHGPIATAVAFFILLGLMLMYFATLGK